MVDNGVGAFETDPAKIADIMGEWLDPDNREAFMHMAHRSKALGRPHAVYDIVHDLAHMANTLGLKARQLDHSCCRRKGCRQMEVEELVAA